MRKRKTYPNGDGVANVHDPSWIAASAGGKTHSASDPVEP